MSYNSERILLEDDEVIVGQIESECEDVTNAQNENSPGNRRKPSQELQKVI